GGGRGWGGGGGGGVDTRQRRDAKLPVHFGPCAALQPAPLRRGWERPTTAHREPAVQHHRDVRVVDELAHEVVVELGMATGDDEHPDRRRGCQRALSGGRSCRWGAEAP